MKNKLLKLSSLIPMLTAVWLTSCYIVDKEEPRKIVIQGHVTEYGTNAPLKGARIYLWCYSGQIFGPTNSAFVDSLVTDADGYFHAEYLDKDLCDGIYLSAFKEGYFYRSDIDIISGVNDLKVEMRPESWLKIRTIPDQGGNSIIVAGSNFYGGSGYNVYSWEGDMSRIFNTIGNEIKYIHWYSGVDYAEHHEDTIYLPRFDTTTYTIHY